MILKALRPGRPLAFGLALVLAVAQAQPARAQSFDLPDLSSPAEAMLTPAAEARLGRAFMWQVREALPVLEDALLSDYLERLGARLARADPNASGNYHFFFIDRPLVNAFAGPGGHIGIFTGLVLATESESELAAVMAHEIAHLTQHHLLRGIEDRRRLNLPTTALLVAAAILGAQVSPDAGMAAMAGIQAAALQHQINFTRENEHEADRLGILTLARAGYDPFAMAGFFERIARLNRVEGSEAPEFLRTHPVSSTRIAEALERAGDHGARQHPDSLRFHLTRAALRVRALGRAELAVEQFRDTLRSGRHGHALAERYGLALALERAREFGAAREEAAALLKAHPLQPEFVALEARIDTAQGRHDQALVHLRQALSLDPAAWPLRLALAETLLVGARPKDAMDELIALIRQRPDSLLLHERLVEAALKLGDRGAVYRHRAELLYLRGDREAAIKQLQIALRQRDLPYHDAARLQARLDALREEAREEKERGDPLGAR